MFSFISTVFWSFCFDCFDDFFALLFGEEFFGFAFSLVGKRRDSFFEIPLLDGVSLSFPISDQTFHQLQPVLFIQKENGLGLSYLILVIGGLGTSFKLFFLFLIEFDHETSLSRKVRFHSVMCIDIGDEVPKEWDIQPINQLARDQLALEEYTPDELWAMRVVD